MKHSKKRYYPVNTEFLCLTGFVEGKQITLHFIYLKLYQAAKSLAHKDDAVAHTPYFCS